MKSLHSLLFLSLVPFAHAFAADAAPASPLEPFLRRDVFGTIKISPTGEFLAVTAPRADRTNLTILRRSDMKPTASITLGKNVHVSEFNWVNPNLVLFSVARKFGELEQPQETGELFRLKANGSIESNQLIAYADLIDDLRDEDDTVLVSVWLTGGYTEILRLNTNGGDGKVIGKVPVQGAWFLTDAGGVVRFGVGSNSDLKQKTYYRSGEGGNWELIDDEAVTAREVDPLGFSADGKTAYLEVEEASGPDGVYSFDTTTKKRTLLLRDAVTDPTEVFRSPLDGSVYAIGFGDGIPRVEYLDPDSPFAKLHRSLQANFPDAAVMPISFTKDGNLGLYLIYSDRIPGDFYLFDRVANKATFIASKNSWFKPEMLNATRTINLTARDGTPLHGFLTVPKSSPGKNMPMVVLPHGGPFGINDEWGYDPEVQLLADHGYAVLQLNFRGSSNYGRAFEWAGHKQWGGTMQDDLSDATRWAVAQGLADSGRICIYGASYGGYAALMGVAKDPDLYRCAIGYVGVYDMAALFHEDPGSKSTMNFYRETVGDQANIAAISPNLLAARIKVPVMLVAGKEDDTAPPKHTELMRDALKAAGKSVESTIYDGEGHGFYLMKNKIDFYTRLLAFLDRNIGASAPAPVPAD